MCQIFKHMYITTVFLNFSISWCLNISEITHDAWSWWYIIIFCDWTYWHCAVSITYAYSQHMVQSHVLANWKTDTIASTEKNLLQICCHSTREYFIFCIVVFGDPVARQWTGLNMRDRCMGGGRQGGVNPMVVSEKDLCVICRRCMQ